MGCCWYTWLLVMSARMDAWTHGRARTHGQARTTAHAWLAHGILTRKAAARRELGAQRDHGPGGGPAALAMLWPRGAARLHVKAAGDKADFFGRSELLRGTGRAQEEHQQQQRPAHRDSSYDAAPWRTLVVAPWRCRNAAGQCSTLAAAAARFQHCCAAASASC
jgi:hypothetical protein